MSERAGSYRELLVWQRSMVLAQQVYAITRTWPREELYGLTSQVRRAAVSIPSNLAEGQGRTGRGEFLHHVSIAHGSLCELETQLTLASRLGFSTDSQVLPLLAELDEIGKMTRALLRKIRENQS